MPSLRELVRAWPIALGVCIGMLVAGQVVRWREFDGAAEWLTLFMGAFIGSTIAGLLMARRDLRRHRQQSANDRNSA